MKLEPAATISTIKRLVYNIDKKYATKVEVSKLSDQIPNISEADTDEINNILTNKNNQ